MIRTCVFKEIINNIVKTREQQSYRFIASLPKQDLKNDNSLIDKDTPNITINPYTKEKQKCILCKLKIEPDYKNVRLLSQFQSRYTGRIYGKHITGLCKYQQMRVESEILKAQNAGLMGYFTKDPKYVNDPPLFDPSRPVKPHNY
ncbi:hypothetical protein KPH14_001443 [Odynerus spinipes]|uniref:Ribosomal protein S18 n=1 Tax=Odynerus spinipes TaxID=1348599 RepID=A0AAD9RUH5_9HYME|nr:hypothetical protein KPH14_001443 [Odynerus spinipes]